MAPEVLPLELHVARLLAFCERVAAPVPSHAATLILDTSDPRVIANRGWTLPASVLVQVPDFAPRFRTLLASGYSWINLSAYGVFRSALIVGLELPRERGDVPEGFTSVNYSGPSIGVTGTPSWELELTLVE